VKRLTLSATIPVASSVASALALGMLLAAPANAQQALGSFSSDLIVSSAGYSDPGFASGSLLPNSSTFTTPNVFANTSSAFCSGAALNCSTNVWNNVLVDANFGITANVVLQDVNTTTGAVDNTVNVSALAAAQGINLNTSFSSKSELALNLTPDGSGLTFMAYNATAGQLDISNSNTPGVSEPGNTDVATPTYRAVGQLNLSNNSLQVTTTNAYNGNNGRAAILGANGQYYMVGNAGNGNGSANTTAGTGVQLLTPGNNATATTPGTANVGQYSITQQGYAADKTPKDNNFRGETIFNNTLYVTKGSGSNGIDTVYQVGTVGSLPAAGNSTPITILPGFNTQLAKTDAETPHPFGIWFANADTLYVADEGSGASTDFGTSPTTQAGGLDKYSLVKGVWTLDYALKGSLIGSSYTVNGTGSLANYSLTTTTDGLRNLTGQVNGDGTVTLYAVTSTEGSVLGDSGADPNQIVAITDTLANTSASAAAAENFTVLDTAALGQVYRGVALAPVPLPAGAWLLLSGLGALALMALMARPRRAISHQTLPQMNILKLPSRLALFGALLCASAASNAASIITDWDFGSLAATSPDNTPAATTGTGTASSLGMTNGYTYTTGGVTTGVGAVTLDDVTNDSPSGTKNGSTLGNGNVWRIRGVAGAGTTGTTNNGWNNSAPQYSQGAEFDTSTVGYNVTSLSFNWAATTQGIGNLQVQYTTNGSSWSNIGSVYSATIDNNTTGTSGSGFQVDTIDLSGISGLSNDPSFGVRLVAAYNPTLGNEYASATSVVSGAPAQYNNNSGNWRIADVQIDGTALTPVPLPAAVWLLLSGLGGVGALTRRKGSA
jgi:hypothetical protein